MARAEVRSDETGEWAIIVVGEGQPAAHARSQREAENEARRIVRSKGGGEVIIHARSGRIRDKQTVPSGPGPNGHTRPQVKKRRRLTKFLGK